LTHILDRSNFTKPGIAAYGRERLVTVQHGSADTVVRSMSVIPRLHDQANIEQSSSKHPANAFKLHVHDVCSNCSMFA